MSRTYKKVCALPTCGSEFEAKGPNARFCSPGHRNRAHRLKTDSSTDRGTDTTPEIPGDMTSVESSLLASTRATLQRSNATDHPDGISAIYLARRIETYGAESAAGYVALVKEHRAALAAALAESKGGAESNDDGNDLLGDPNADSGSGGWTLRAVT